VAQRSLHALTKADIRESPSLADAVPNSDLILPKWSRRVGFLILLTFDGGNNRQKARGDNAFFLTLADIEELIRWTFSLKNRMRTFLVAVGSHKMHIFTANIPTFHTRYRR
jgi:hypothetical protein